jgi:hypothetical protein
MPYALNNVTTQNAYVPATTLQCPDSVRFNLHVFNASIYWRIGNAPGVTPGAQSGAEIFRAPGYYSMDRYLDQVEVRSGVAGVPAQVTIDAWREGELSE